MSYFEIPIERSGFRALISAEDIDIISAHRWYLYRWKKTLYTQNNKGVQMHQLILPPKEGFVRHHKNGNGLDNRRENLEYRTNLENLQDKGIYSSNTTGVPGVKLRSNYSGPFKYQVQITVFKRRIHLGVFKTLEDARAAREAAERKYR